MTTMTLNYEQRPPPKPVGFYLTQAIQVMLCVWVSYLVLTLTYNRWMIVGGTALALWTARLIVAIMAKNKKDTQ